MVAGDGVRLAALVSVVVGSLQHGAVAGAVLFLVLGGTVVPRAAGAPAALDAAYCLVILVGAWAAVLDWYLVVPWLDLVVHAAATGLVAAVAHWVLVRVGAVPEVAGTGGTGLVGTGLRRPGLGAAVLTTALGTSLAFVWELMEWFGHTYLDDRIQVGYTDTLGDLAAGMVGAVLAGGLVASGLLLRGARR